MNVLPVLRSSQIRLHLGRVWRIALVFVCAATGLSACGPEATRVAYIPTPTLAIRHRDANALMPSADDLGRGYQTAEKHRLERGKGWGEDTTRLSGYRNVFAGSQSVFSRIECQIECYLSVTDTQAAFRALREQLNADLKGNVANDSVTDGEERMLGDWNRVFTVRSGDDLALHYIFLRENVLVDLAMTGTDAPDLPDQAARLARLLDERIFQ